MTWSATDPSATRRSADTIANRNSMANPEAKSPSANGSRWMIRSLTSIRRKSNSWDVSRIRSRSRFDRGCARESSALLDLLDKGPSATAINRTRIVWRRPGRRARHVYSRPARPYWPGSSSTFAIQWPETALSNVPRAKKTHFRFATTGQACQRRGEQAKDLLGVDPACGPRRRGRTRSRPTGPAARSASRLGRCPRASRGRCRRGTPTVSRSRRRSWEPGGRPCAGSDRSRRRARSCGSPRSGR